MALDKERSSSPALSRKLSGYMEPEDEDADEALKAPVPPCPQKKPHRVMENNGVVIMDDYFWLKEKDNPEVLAYLKDENAYGLAVMEHTEELQNTLYEEYCQREFPSETSAVKKVGEFFYYTRYEADLAYELHCRKQHSMENHEEIILNENEWAEGEDYFSIGALEVSPNHNLLAFSTDTTGSEKFRIYVRNLETREYLNEDIGGAYWTVRWAADNKTFFYSTVDDTGRSNKMFRHVIGDHAHDGSSDDMVYEEKDVRFFLDITQTNSRKYLVMSVRGQITTEMWVLRADVPHDDFRCVIPRREGVVYDVTHHGKSFYIRTNENAINFKLVKAPETDPANRDLWEEVLPNRDFVYIESATAYRHHLVVWEWDHGSQRIRVQDLSDEQVHYVNIGHTSPVYNVFPGEKDIDSENPETFFFNTSHLRYTYTNFIQPALIYDYDMDNEERFLRKQEVVIGLIPENYTQEKLFATADDGEQIPISLVYHSAKRTEGGNPLLLCGYSAYGGWNRPCCVSDDISLLDRGFIIAIAHGRGDADMGGMWYQQGKKKNKRTSFTDFITCAKFLQAKGYTTPDLTAARGRSAGGLIMGYIANLEEHVFSAVVADVPFVDVFGDMCDPSIPWTAYEWDEWGDPNDPETFDYMRTYDPYTNVKRKAYPHMLLTGGLNDSRVGFWEPAKMAARIRAHMTNDAKIILQTYLAGHLGSGSKWDEYEHTSFKHAFLIDTLGVAHDVRTRTAVANILPDVLTPPALVKMFKGYQVTMLVHAAMELGVFKALLDLPKQSHTAKGLSHHLHATERGVRIILNALASVGLLVQTAVSDTDHYDLTDIAQLHLVPGSPNFVGDEMHLSVDANLWENMWNLKDIVRKGIEMERPLAEIYEEQAKHSHYTMSLAAATIQRNLLPWAIRRKPFHVLDVPCGSGLVGFGMVKSIATARLWSMDTKDVVAVAEERVKQFVDAEEKTTFVVGDFFTSNMEGPYDLVILNRLLSKLSWEQTKMALNRATDVLKSTGRIVILDHVTDSDHDPSAALESLSLLVLRKRGEVRSVAQYQRLLAKLGYAPPSILRIEGTPLKALITSSNIVTHKHPSTKKEGLFSL